MCSLSKEKWCPVPQSTDCFKTRKKKKKPVLNESSTRRAKFLRSSIWGRDKKNLSKGGNWAGCFHLTSLTSLQTAMLFTLLHDKGGLAIIVSHSATGCRTRGTRAAVMKSDLIKLRRGAYKLGPGPWWLLLCFTRHSQLTVGKSPCLGCVTSFLLCRPCVISPKTWGNFYCVDCRFVCNMLIFEVVTCLLSLL